MNYLLALLRSVGIWAQVRSGCGLRSLTEEDPKMSELREEAAIAREALVRDKKKTKQQTTLSTKWNIVLDYGEPTPAVVGSRKKHPRPP